MDGWNSNFALSPNHLNHQPDSSIRLPTWHLSRFHPPPPNRSSEDDGHLCKAILYDEIRDTSIRVWDAMILLPNVIFLLYLLVQCRRSRDRIRQLGTFPILRNFYIFIFLCIGVSITRCFVSVVMKVNTVGGDITDKIFWVIVRFFLLSTEISVLVFGLFSGHLDVRQSIRRILTITLIVALVYSVCQGSFEIVAPDASFYIETKEYYLFAHGGMIFWFATCFLSSALYATVVLLPYSPCRNRLLLPTKRSFYIYAAILSIGNAIQAIGALLFYLGRIEGLCIVDGTSYFYFTLFTPLVYFTFISPFLAAGSSASAASAMVTTTAGVESAHNPNRPAVSLARPTQLFASGLRGAVNFSYRPQLDDDDLAGDEDEFLSSTGSGVLGASGGLHFDHYGPYAYNQGRHGYLVYGGAPPTANQSGSGLSRDFSSFSISATSGPPAESSLLGSLRSDSNSNQSQIQQQQQRNSNELDSSRDRLLQHQQQQQEESHMLRNQRPDDSSRVRSSPEQPKTTRT